MKVNKPDTVPEGAKLGQTPKLANQAQSFGLAAVKQEGSANPDYAEPTPEERARAEARRKHREFMEDFELAFRSACSVYDAEHDDWQPSYSWFSKIQSQISQAQSGRGPIRMRLLKIAVLAIAGIESIDRKEES